MIVNRRSLENLVLRIQVEAKPVSPLHTVKTVEARNSDPILTRGEVGPDKFEEIRNSLEEQIRAANESMTGSGQSEYIANISLIDVCVEMSIRNSQESNEQSAAITTAPILLAINPNALVQAVQSSTSQPGTATTA